MENQHCCHRGRLTPRLATKRLAKTGGKNARPQPAHQLQSEAKSTSLPEREVARGTSPVASSCTVVAHLPATRRVVVHVGQARCPSVPCVCLGTFLNGLPVGGSKKETSNRHQCLSDYQQMKSTHQNQFRYFLRNGSPLKRKPKIHTTKRGNTLISKKAQNV